jgi:hypothetical protein
MSATNKAAFIVQSDTKVTPEDGFNFLVCNPTVNPVQVSEMSGGGACFAYIEADAFPLYGAGNLFYDGMRRVMGKHFLRDKNGMPIVNLSDDGKPQSVMIELTIQAAEDYAGYMNDHLTPGFTGKYIDQCFARPPAWWLAKRGDNGVDSRRWPHYIDHLIVCLGGTVTGNIGGQLGSTTYLSGLSGVTIENRHIGTDGERRAAIRTFANAPFEDFCAVWPATPEESVPEWNVPGLCREGVRLG